MNAQAAPQPSARPQTTARPQLTYQPRPGPLRRTAPWSLPLLFGLAVGLYAAWLDSNNEASDGTHIAVVGVVSGAVTAVLCYVLGRVQGSLIRELRATAYGAVAGLAFGYLFSLSGWTWLKSTFGGIVVGLAMGLSAFYVFHCRDD